MSATTVFLVAGGALLIGYLFLCAVMYLAVQPFGPKLFELVAWPLQRIKRAFFGSEPLLVDYRARPIECALFDGERNAEFEGIVLTEPSLVKALPADVMPRGKPETLSQLLRESVARTLPTRLRSHAVAETGGELVRHVFDFGWTRAECLSAERTLDQWVSVLIPGSGFDNSSRVLRKEGYHGALIDQFPGTKLVYVRPNNDCRQILYKGRRANFDCLYTTLLGINSSYSYWFVQELVEIVDALHARSHKVIVGGLSQGGGTAMLVGAVTKAQVTVVLSGYYNPDFGMIGNQHQIQIPGLWPFLLPEKLGPLFSGRGLICSYGKKDLPVYRYEAETGKLCARLRGSGVQLRCVAHAGGHEAPPNLRAVIREIIRFYGEDVAEN